MLTATVSAPPVSHTIGSPEASSDTPGRARERRRSRGGGMDEFAGAGPAALFEPALAARLVESWFMGSQLQRPPPESQPDQFGRRIHDEGQEEQSQRREEQGAEMRAVADRFGQLDGDIGG